MITIQSDLNIITSYPINSPYSWEDIIFFDIETTGLSAKTSYIYLIGCMYLKESNWIITQWVADDMNSEVAILNAFSELIHSYKRLVHFNGSGFDIPFILKKCNQYGLQNPFDEIESFDIYKQVLPYKKLLPLTNYKLKTIESFFHINREDSYTGEELIQIYANYLGKAQYERLHQISIQKQNPSINQSTTLNSYNNVPASSGLTASELLNILLLHNKEDVTGLMQIADILYYINIFTNHSFIKNLNSKIVSETNWTLIYTMPSKFPYTIAWKTPLLDQTIELIASDNQLTLLIPVYQDELKFFYNNYKDYYYLPKEDMAIHTSVAQYVDKEYRVKAKASTCYTKQSGSFLPQPIELLSPSFKKEYTDKLQYIECTNPMLEISSNLANYAQLIIQYIFTNKETKLCYDEDMK